MAAISASPPSTVAAVRRPSPLLHLSPPVLRPFPRRSLPRLVVSSRLYPASGANGSRDDEPPSPDGGDSPLPPHSRASRASRGAPVFITLPVDAVDPSTGRMTRAKIMEASFAALSAAGVAGVTMEVWWGIVERDAPEVYDWTAYADLLNLAHRYDLKVRAVMAFHHCGPSPDWIPLPRWVLEEMEKEPDLSYSDRFGRRSKEYISLGCDNLPVLRGRCPIQAYSDFMRSFRDTFREFLGVVITEIQVGMGPAGELRYPSCPSERLIQPGTPELGEFQCYDKYMIESLNDFARDKGKPNWGKGPSHFGTLSQDPERTSFFSSSGTWQTAYGNFFLQWYSGMLLLHGERLGMVAEAVFCNTGITISAKVAGIYKHYNTISHPSELTAGYYNTLIKDGYLPIALMFSRYRMTLCCTCFDKRDDEEHLNPKSSPEGYLRRLVHAARMYNLPLSVEISVTRLDDTSLKQVIKNSRIYCHGADKPTLSFNYLRMNRNMFETRNWTQITRFVKQVSDFRTFQAKLDFRRIDHASPMSAAEGIRRAFVYH